MDTIVESPAAVHRLVMLAFPLAQSLDITGPLEVFTAANALRRPQGLAPYYQLVLAAAEAGPVVTSCGITLHAEASYHAAGLRPDTLMLAGGDGARLLEDPMAHENSAFAKAERFIRREDRLFLRRVSDPHAPLVTF